MTVILPIFAIILLGAVFRRAGFLGEGFWPHAEKLTYYVLFPCLLAGNLSTARFGDFAVLTTGGAIVTAILAVTALLLFLRPRLAMDGPAFTSLFQGSIRMNTYLGIATAMVLAGADGVTLSAVVIISVIPLVNVLCVTVLAHHGRDNGGGLLATLRCVLTNPLILGCAAGIALNVLGAPLPPSLFEIVHILGRAALPLGLLAVGAGLSFRNLRNGVLPLALSSVVKLGLLPLLTFLACEFYGVPDTPRLVAVLFMALPTSPASYILARQLGGDEDLMSVIITVQTVLAAATLPLVTYLLA